MDGMGQQLFAGTRFTQQQNRAVGLGRSSGLPFQIGHDRTGPHKTGKTETSLTQGGPCFALCGQGIACFVQLALHQGKFGHQWLQIGFRLIKQHHTQSANDHPGLITQGESADQKSPCFVGQQIDEYGFTRFHHLAHLGVVHHLHHRPADKILLFVKP